MSLCGFVVNCPNDVIQSPSKHQLNRTSTWFDFCLITEKKRFRIISFCKQHLSVLKSVNGSKTVGVELVNVDQEADGYKLTVSSLLKKVQLDKYFNPPHAPMSTIEGVINVMQLNTYVSVKCLVTSKEENSFGNKSIYKYNVSDRTGQILLVSFNDPALVIGKVYEIHNLIITDFNNEKQLRLNVCSSVHEKAEQSKELIEENVTNSDVIYENVQIVSVEPGEKSSLCEKCKSTLHTKRG